MKKIISVLILLIIGVGVSAQKHHQGRMEAKSNVLQPKKAERKYDIFVTNEDKVPAIKESNARLLALRDASRGATERGLLGDLIKTAFKTSFVQKSVNASSNLVSLGVSYLSEAIKGDREKWYSAAQQQCHYSHKLSAETKIEDFYALPSAKGALDPENIKFEGFGCKNYIEIKDAEGEGVDVFYIFCKLRRDSVGLNHIVNHSKFLVEIDTLFINPKYCNLPNDSTGGEAGRFDFEKRDNLNLTVNVNIYSSWLNQAMMIADNQLLGRFSINVKVDKKKLNANGCFVYDKNDPYYEKLVSVDGDCFIVPRSFTGTQDAQNYQPTWGTGQYRVEMEVSETCRIVDSYYQIREAGNGRAVAFDDGTPGNKRWDKAKWQTEWREMKARRKNASVLTNVWQSVVSAYKGSGWVATFTDPIATSLYSYETTKLNKLLNVPTQQSAATKPAAAQPAASQAAMPQQLQPKGNSKK